MLLLLGTKRLHAQTSSDTEDDGSTSTSGSFKTAQTGSPSNTRSHRSSPRILDIPHMCTPSVYQKRKLPRYRLPCESPTNVFRVGNEAYWQRLNKGPGSLPYGVTTLLELRLQLKRVKVYREVQIPTNYTFAHLNQLVLFLFGWSGTSTHSSLTTSTTYNTQSTTPATLISSSGFPVSSPHTLKCRHSWRLAKDVVKVTNGKRREGEIESSREWVRLYPASRLQKERDAKLGDVFDVASVRIEDEEEWTIANLWGPRGAFNQRGAVYTYHHGFGFIVDITLKRAVKAKKPTNLPRILVGEGAPLQEFSSERCTKEVPEHKIFIINTFKGNAFERWLQGELVVCLDSDGMAVQRRVPSGPFNRLRQKARPCDDDDVEIPPEVEVSDDAIIESDEDGGHGPSRKRARVDDSEDEDDPELGVFADVSSSNSWRRRWG